MGLPIFAEERSVWNEWLIRALSQAQSSKTAHVPALVMTPNAEQFVQASSDSSFWHSLSQADVLLPDGAGLVLAARLLFGADAIADRLAGADLLSDVISQARAQQLKVLVVGGRDYARPNQFGHATLQVQLPDGSSSALDWTPGYFDIAHPTPTEHATVRWVINHLKPDVVLVAFGAPWQEAWAIRHQELLASVGTRLVMVIGGAEIFSAALPFAQRIYWTEIHAAPEGDIRFARPDPAVWREVRREPLPRGEKDEFAATLTVLERC